MIRLTNVACIEASRDKVWAVLADLENVNLWVETIKSARCDENANSGTGALRTCQLTGGLEIKERWTAWEEGSSYEYEASDLPFIRSAINRWTLEQQGAKTLVTSDAEIRLKGGIFAKLIEPIMGPMMKAMGPRTLAALAYFVENGEPYRGKYRTLPQLPTSC